MRGIKMLGGQDGMQPWLANETLNCAGGGVFVFNHSDQVAAELRQDREFFTGLSVFLLVRLVVGAPHNFVVRLGQLPRASVADDGGAVLFEIPNDVVEVRRQLLYRYVQFSEFVDEALVGSAGVFCPCLGEIQRASHVEEGVDELFYRRAGGNFAADLIRQRFGFDDLGRVARVAETGFAETYALLAAPGSARHFQQRVVFKDNSAPVFRQRG